MAQTYEIEIEAQPGIYRPEERTLKIYFAEPEKVKKKSTGILLILAGYGGNATSKVYTKMRESFADEFQLVTVQCDYFGYEFMQNSHPADIGVEAMKEVLSEAEIDLLQRDYEKYAHLLLGKEFVQHIELGETPAYFNDMGLMQAIDNLRAVKVVMDIMEKNGYAIDENRIYAYGFSHGGYLAYLCNALWPGLLTGIVDNSSYLIPWFLKNPREFSFFEDGIRIRQFTTYRALEFVGDEEILNLPFLYQNVANQAEILCYAGEADYMTMLEDKKAFLNQVEHSRVETITKYRVDRKIFLNTEHGLGADFLELFRMSYKQYLQVKEMERKKKREKHHISYEPVCYETSGFRYEVRWEQGIPVLYRMRK